MKGEVQFIKKQIFGGFNRKDVVDYVAKIAKERNEALEVCSEASTKIIALTAVVDELNAELQKCNGIISRIGEQKRTQLEVEKLRSLEYEPESNVGQPEVEQPVVGQPVKVTKKVRAKPIQKRSAKVTRKSKW